MDDPTKHSIRVPAYTLRVVPAVIAVAVFLLAAPGGHYVFDLHFFTADARGSLSKLSNGEPGSVYSLVRHPYDAGAGRVWPLMRPYFLALYAMFGTNFILWQWWVCGLLILTTQLIYSITARLTPHRFAPLGASLLYLLYFPAYTNVHKLHWLEFVTAPLICASLLCLLGMHRAATRPVPRRLHVWSWAVAAALTAVMTLGFKETSLALMPAILLIAAHYAIAGPKIVRLPAMSIVAITAALSAWLAYTITTGSLRSGWYTRAYGSPDPLAVIATIEWWRESLLTIYGPVVVLWGAALVVRLTLAVRMRRWTTDLTWRAALAGTPIAMIVLLSPWSDPRHYLFFPAIVFMAVGVAWETGDFAARLVSPPDLGNKGPDARSRLIPWLAIASILAWCAPLSGSPSALALKFAALFASIALAAALTRREAINLSVYRGWSRASRTAGKIFLALSLAHLIVFALPNVFLLPVLERQRYESMELPIRYLVKHVPESSAIALAWPGYNAHGAEQVKAHFVECHGATGVRFRRFGAQPEPEDFVFNPALRDDKKLEFPGRERIDFSTRALVYKPDLVQPSKLAARALGARPLRRAVAGAALKTAAEDAYHSMFYPHFGRNCALCWVSMGRSVYLPERSTVGAVPAQRRD